MKYTLAHLMRTISLNYQTNLLYLSTQQQLHQSVSVFGYLFDEF